MEKNEIPAIVFVKPEDKQYTKDQMFFFAGFLHGALEKDPTRDVGDIFEEWNLINKLFFKDVIS